MPLPESANVRRQAHNWHQQRLHRQQQQQQRQHSSSSAAYYSSRHIEDKTQQQRLAVVVVDQSQPQHRQLQLTNNDDDNNNNSITSCHNCNCQQRHHCLGGGRCCSCQFWWMLTLGTHKIYKITSLTIDSYKQLFAVITMLLTVLSVQQSNAAFAMAVPVRASVSSSSAPPASAPSQAAQDLSVLASVPVQQHNLLQHHTKHLHSLAPLTRMQHGHLQHPEAQLNLLLDNTNNNNNNINNNHHNNANHHHYEHQSETDIATEERLLHKRHTSWHDLYDQTMNSNDIVWYNPCGGHYVNINDSKTAKKKSPMKKVSGSWEYGD